MLRCLPLLLALAIALSPLAKIPEPAQAAECQFVLGFLSLQQMIPDIVGNCLTNVQYNPANGDGLQMTTGWHGNGGMLVWRKADNFTAFTDGYHTWVNGPFGLQERLNSQRFFWEWNPDELVIVPPPVPGDRCHTAQLSLSVQSGEGGAGHVGNTMRFTNNAPVLCTFYGYVGALMLDAQNNALPTQVIRGGGFIFKDPGPSLITVPAGRPADFGLEWSTVPVGDETICPQASQIAVIPPNEYAPIVIPMTLAPCRGGTIHVTAVHPPS